MDEKEFRVLIKHYFMKSKTPQETKEKLDKHYGDSAPSIRTVISGFKIFGVAIWAQVTLNVLDALLRAEYFKQRLGCFEKHID
uniref:Mos1 transposase HTH domain-containing protein n=1 Tax=Rhodnius prolixus TaxID=13249 RepID=T1HN64_RHOPR